MNRSTWFCGTRFVAACATTVAISAVAEAAILITEVNPTGSGTSTYAADWFELTNTAAVAVDISGWKVDDNSALFSSALALRGVSSIGPGQSVVFIEGNTSGSNDATVQANFIAAWFGGSAPAGFTIGGYGGSGIGLGSGGDAVNIYDAGGALQASVSFAAATANVTFDNAAGLNNAPLSALSVAGVSGAFANAGGEIGSPGAIATVPEPAAALLAVAASLAGLAIRRK